MATCHTNNMISKEEVEHIAKLARLELTEKEVAKMQKDLTGILDYFNLLKNVPEIKIKSAEVLDVRARKDEVINKDVGIGEKLVALAPDKKDGYIKVKAIL
jgi:aspartyl/glutamyl-tRNA(Asn/Gln) amidotransferase C subunit